MQSTEAHSEWSTDVKEEFPALPPSWKLRAHNLFGKAGPSGRPAGGGHGDLVRFCGGIPWHRWGRPDSAGTPLGQLCR